MAECPKCGWDEDVIWRDSWTATANSYAPSLNETGINSKTNHTYRNWRKKWAKQFGAWLKTIPTATQRRRVSITRYMGKGQRAYDRQNFASGCKPLLDTIVEYGGLYDDSPNWCSDFYEQKRSPNGKDYVVVTIEEMAPNAT